MSIYLFRAMSTLKYMFFLTDTSTLTRDSKEGLCPYTPDLHVYEFT